MEKPCNLFFVSEPAVGEANIVVAAKIREAMGFVNVLLSCDSI